MKNHTNIGGYEVPNDLLDPYCDKIVKRLRATMCRAGIQIAMARNAKLIEMVMSMEGERRRLHAEILASIGLNEHTPECNEFSFEFNKYVDARAGSLSDHMNSPLGMVGIECKRDASGNTVPSKGGEEK